MLENKRFIPLFCLAITLIASLYVLETEAHGYLFDPPARSSAWVVDPDFKDCCTNYNHNQMFCGGFGKQWRENGGRCGICGDDWSDSEPRNFERGGKNYLGKIVKVYKKNTKIPVSVIITANHLGHSEFRLCNVDGWATEATQECLNKTLLQVENTNSYKYKITKNMLSANYSLTLPKDFTCNHCVLQWKYVTGNTWGTDDKTGKSCVGCGPVQENFLGCSDISIRDDMDKTTPATPTPTTATTTKETSVEENNETDELIIDVEINRNVSTTTKKPTTTGKVQEQGYNKCESILQFGTVLNITKLVNIYCNRICKTYCPKFVFLETNYAMNNPNRVACIETCPLLCSCT